MNVTDEVEFQKEPVKKQLEYAEFKALTPDEQQRARKEGFTEGLLRHGPKFKRDEPPK